MASNSRYARLLRAAGFIQVASEQLRQVPAGQLDRAMSLARVKATTQQAASQLEEIADECSMAKGMYASNKSIRDALTDAGTAIRAELPHLSTAIAELDKAAQHQQLDVSPIADLLSRLATVFASISFTPQLGRRSVAVPSPDDTLTD